MVLLGWPLELHGVTTLRKLTYTGLSRATAHSGGRERSSTLDGERRDVWRCVELAKIGFSEDLGRGKPVNPL